MITTDVIVDTSLLALLMITSIYITIVKDVLTSTIVLSIFSLLMAALYLSLSAPDVAITEAAVGAGISTILLLYAITLTGTKEKKTKFKFFPFFTVIITSFILVYATSDVPEFGNPNTPVQTHVASHYLDKSYDEIGIPNTVTSVLASYRGFDTLGETFVIFAAAASIILLLWNPKKKKA